MRQCEDFDIDLYRLSPTPASEKNTGSKNRIKIKKDLSGENWFIQGPFPGVWFEIAAKLPGHSLHVALAIWYARGVARNKNEIPLERFHLDRLGVEKDSARRALQRLQEAGLITYRKSGQKFLVTIIDVVPS
jgi:hypothetical protein